MPHDRLTDPPRCVRGELESTSPIESINRSHEAEGRLLDEILKIAAAILVLLRDGDRKSNVRLNHPVASCGADRDVLALHLLGELNLSLTGKERVTTDLLEE
jgi:hypothetical protein